MIVYYSFGQYIRSCSDVAAKIAAIDEIIEKLLVTAADAATSDNFSEYMMNDGQSIVKSTYKGVDGIAESIRAFEKLRSFYVNKNTGTRIVRLVDGKNFTRKRYGRR